MPRSGETVTIAAEPREFDFPMAEAKVTAYEHASLGALSATAARPDRVAHDRDVRRAGEEGGVTMRYRKLGSSDLRSRRSASARG
jgi:hypothetical protein